MTDIKNTAKGHVPTPAMPGRRRFMKQHMVVAGGLAVTWGLGGCMVAGAGKGTASGTPGTALLSNPFLRILPDDSVIVVVPQAEMGQGITTSLPMLVADELDADWSKVRMEFAPANEAYVNRFFGMQATGGSLSHRVFTEPMRKVGATARAMLVQAAAARWNVDPASCRTENSTVIGPAGQRLSYGALSAEAARLPVPAEVPLKRPDQFRLIGKDMRRLDTLAKSTGKAVFGVDVAMDGLLTALIARPPHIGDTVARFDPTAAMKRPGVRAVVQIPAGIAVVATDYWHALKGREALDVTWAPGGTPPPDTDAITATLRSLADTAVGAPYAKRTGDVATVRGARTIDAVYEAPFLAHACLEPMNCTAHVRPDGVDIWGPFQGVGNVHKQGVRMTGLPPEQVKVHSTFLGGGFGRRFADDFVIDALAIAKQVPQPVKLMYTREDDMRAQFYRPASVTRFKATLDAAGKPLAMTARVACPSVARSVALAGAPLAVVDGVDRFAVEAISNHPYDIPATAVQWAEHDAGVRVFVWRAVGYSQNGFFMEGFLDEMAHAAGQDPVAYRAALLSQKPRHRRVLELAALKAGWATPPAPGRARGVAVVESYGSFVAEVVEVSKDGDRIQVEKVVCAIDCGMVVNPLTVRAQAESAILFGLSAAMYGKITVDDGMVAQSNFHDYPVVRMQEVPAIEVHIVPNAEGIGGAGEVALPPLAPALTNAVFALTGKRVRSLPLSEHGMA